jgi:zinc finger protein
MFLNLEENTPSQEMESLCVSCEKNGKTKFMFSRIPFFKEIILSAFDCEHCGFKNSEV